MKIGFDNEKYLKMQSQHIMERIGKFDNKLYLEFGGKLFDDFHASRVLPGFAADSKLQMLMQLADQAEIVMVVSADDIEKNKIPIYNAIGGDEVKVSIKENPDIQETEVVIHCNKADELVEKII